jgi:fatty acid-binding protein DegV
MQSPFPLKRFGMMHSNAEEDARMLLDKLSPELPTQPLIVLATTVIGAHVGPNGLAFTAQYADKTPR